MSGHGARRDLPGDSPRGDSPLDVLGVSTRVRGVHRLSDGALAARMIGLSGPAGSRLETEEVLRRVAALMRQTAVLDEHAAAVHRDLAVPGGLPLITTVDPSSPARHPDPRHPLSVGVDAHDLAVRPRRVLDAVQAARDDGRRIVMRVGLDDLGPAVLPVVDPDVVVVRAEVLARGRDHSAARLAQELAAHLEGTSAVIVAEGLVVPGDVATAESLGAQFGVGAFFHDTRVEVARDAFPPARSGPSRDAGDRSPFAIVAATRRPRRGGESLLAEMGRSMQLQATGTGLAALLVRSSGDTCELSHLAARTVHGQPAEIGMAPVYGVRVPMIETRRAGGGDPREGWDIAVLGPQVCAALTARAIDPSARDGQATFEFVQTYDRATVIAAMRAMLRGMDGA